MVAIACVGALVRDPGRRLLLVLRAREPARGTWSLPGGRVEPSETTAHACAREVLEETGLIVEVGRHVGRVERSGVGSTTYVIDDYECEVVGGSLAAGTDAADARWLSEEQMRDLPLSPLLWQTLAEWGEVSSSTAR
jgi:ADP-ribose pyrophosphatase YjhB (NUDIX family)